MSADEPSKTIALVGNPNTGKTTLFNALTGANERTGNYSGITVGTKVGFTRTPHGRKLRVLDLPGTYSMEAGSADEKIALDCLHGTQPGEGKPDLVVCVLDASALERQLPLAIQVIRLHLPVIVALNMVDLAEKSGIRLSPVLLSEELGVPVVPIQANAAKGLVELKQALRFPFPHPVPTTLHHEHDTAALREAAKRICAVAARRPEEEQLSLSDKLDSVLLHPIHGWLALAATMFLVFWSIFSLASYPMDWIDGSFGALGAWVEQVMPAGDLRSLIVDGIIGGIGGVLIFLPQIVLLFFFIGLLECSGYMARAAFLMDGVMSRFGLSGKSFLPLFSSYACAIPGVLATRTIPSAKERLATIFIAPWMSCSARLPVYFLIIPMLLGEREGGTWKQALVLFLIYLAGTVSALCVAKLLCKRIRDDEKTQHFILELPSYRRPQWSYILRHVGERAWAFLSQAGTIILGISIILWALSTYPKSSTADDGEQLAHSAIGRVGQIIEPAVKPLGFDGRTGTAILTSFAAREVFNSSMAILFRVEQADSDAKTRHSIRDAISQAKWPNGRPIFTPLTLLSLIVFYIYALQCLPTSAVVAREAGSIKWAVAQFLFMSAFAYIASLLIFQTGKLLGFA